MDGYIGEIRAFAFNFTPDYWLPCDGRSLPIAQNQALYAIIGTIYGGSGNNFNLPNLQGRAPVCAQSSGICTLGKKTG